MSSWMKAQDSFSLILLNDLIPAPVFFHWLTFRMDRSSVLMPSKIDLLIFPSSLFVRFINRQVGFGRNLDNFEKDLMNVINKLEFKKINDKFQRKLKEDIKKVRESPNMLVFADKSTNVYELKPERPPKISTEQHHENLQKSIRNDRTRD